MMRKSLFTLSMLCLLSQPLMAQEKQERFSPEKFRQALESYIVKEACLSPKEAAAFFPLYNEMGQKQRALFGSMRRLEHAPACTDTECRNLIKDRDKLEIELKKIQQTYHNKFLNVLSPKKVLDVLRAEDEFHRHMLRRSDKKNNK